MTEINFYHEKQLLVEAIECGDDIKLWQLWGGLQAVHGYEQAAGVSINFGLPIGKASYTC